MKILSLPSHWLSNKFHKEFKGYPDRHCLHYELMIKLLGAPFSDIHFLLVNKHSCFILNLPATVEEICTYPLLIPYLLDNFEVCRICVEEIRTHPLLIPYSVGNFEVCRICVEEIRMHPLLIPYLLGNFEVCRIRVEEIRMHPLLIPSLVGNFEECRQLWKKFAYILF